MKNKIFSIVLLLISIIGFSQEKFSVELSHPISLSGYFSKNDEGFKLFSQKNIDSYFDIGLGYNFFKTKNINFLFHVNMSYFKDTYIHRYYGAYRYTIITNNYLFQPKIKSVYSFPFDNKLKINFGFSYSFLTFASKESDGGAVGGDSPYNGFGLHTGISYDLFHKLYVLSDYNFGKLYKTGREGIKTSLIKIGLGYRF